MVKGKEDQILLAQIEDRIRQCEEQYRTTVTCFLDMRQRTVAEGMCRRGPGPRYAFYGGYRDAERCMLVLFPDYVSLPGEDDSKGSREVGEEAVIGYFSDHPEEDPLTVLRAETAVSAKGKQLAHRDYLGSLMGLGLKREMIGDILVREGGADILAAREMEDFLLYHYGKAGRNSLTLSSLPLSQLIVPEGRSVEKRDTVASLRLDTVISCIFCTSRGRAAEAIRGGLVFVNNLQIQKTDAWVKEGDKLTLRGQGKAILKEVGGQTKKDRIIIHYQRYL